MAQGSWDELQTKKEKMKAHDRGLIIRFEFNSRNKKLGAIVRHLLKRLWFLPKMFKLRSIEIQDLDGEWKMWRTHKK